MTTTGECFENSILRRGGIGLGLGGRGSRPARLRQTTKITTTRECFRNSIWRVGGIGLGLGGRPARLRHTTEMLGLIILHIVMVSCYPITNWSTPGGFLIYGNLKGMRVTIWVYYGVDISTVLAGRYERRPSSLEHDH